MLSISGVPLVLLDITQARPVPNLVIVERHTKSMKFEDSLRLYRSIM
jgi:hypothetical protein